MYKQIPFTAPFPGSLVNTLVDIDRGPVENIDPDIHHILIVLQTWPFIAVDFNDATTVLVEVDIPSTPQSTPIRPECVRERVDIGILRAQCEPAAKIGVDVSKCQRETTRLVLLFLAAAQAISQK